MRQRKLLLVLTILGLSFMFSQCGGTPDNSGKSADSKQSSKAKSNEIGSRGTVIVKKPEVSEKITKKNKPMFIPVSRINDVSVFKDYKKPTIRVLLIANQTYKNDYASLKYTLNDMKIYKSIFTKLLDVPKDHIHEAYNVTVKGFNKAFRSFIKKVQKDELLIIIYAGHGQTDGMPVMTDGKKVSIKTFHRHFNSFKNDTVLIMDSCYSGAEGSESHISEYGRSGARGLKITKGPKRKKIADIGDKEVKEKRKYRKNVLRLYSSLAHQASREGKFLKLSFSEELIVGNIPFFEKNRV